MTEVLTYEALKAERDALADRVNALAVENAALKARAVTVPAKVYVKDMRCNVVRWAQVVDALSEAGVAFVRDDGELIAGTRETPATDAALAAIEARTERNENLMRFVVEVFNIAAQHCTLNRDEIHKLGQSLGLFASEEFGQETYWHLNGIFQDNSCGYAINNDKSIGIEMFANFCREKAVAAPTAYARSFWSKCGFQASIYAAKLREDK